MYVTTFYSYKGGVGRTMALVNVATLLAQAGKRVLIVDFDLEAPGLPSFSMLKCALGTKGVVDYVEEYQSTLTAPDVSEYITECQGEESRVWLMAAGDNFAPNYTARLNAINWEELYERQFGFLMFEDLKQQWAVYDGKGFDYVLIDSRTGHTDVSGICTRQLADAVVIMFVPNNQNIDGLVPIVDGIRGELGRLSAPIQLHFCPSNVPDEVDENEILDRLLLDAKTKLRFGDPVELKPEVTIIRHRPGLEILDQPIIVLTAPKSQLAKEYAALTTSVRGQNLSDRGGALSTLERLSKLYEVARTSGRSNAVREIADRAREIWREHPEDGKIATRAAMIFDLTGDVEEELAALGVAISAGYRIPRARTSRAITLFKLERRDEALGDVMAVLEDKDGTDFEYRPAMQLLRAAGSEQYVPTVRKLLASRETRLAAKLTLAPLLMGERTHLSELADEMLRLSRSDDVKEERRSDPLNVAELALIGAGRFEEALETTQREHAPPGPVNVAAVFNAAMAQWGLSAAPPSNMLGEDGNSILRLPDSDANIHQCKAIVLALRGERDEAFSHLALAKEKVPPGSFTFSCWPYLYRTAAEMEVDIDEMAKAIEGGIDLKPPFIEGAMQARSPSRP
jgi:MinD-like ATPase involved in chromosome partitioning or flagellar assembly